MASLKKRAGRNLLISLLEEFLKFDQEFNSEVVASILSEVTVDVVPLENMIRFDYYQTNRVNDLSVVRLPTPSGLVDLTSDATADQSSMSPWSIGNSTQSDARNAIDPEFSGSYAFHTLEEDTPWWQATFSSVRYVGCVRIHNRIDNYTNAVRCVNFVLEVSTDGTHWREVYRKDDNIVFGGRDGQPFSWQPADPVACSSLRIRLIDRGYLHFERVEIFGRL